MFWYIMIKVSIDTSSRIKHLNCVFISFWYSVNKKGTETIMTKKKSVSIDVCINAPINLVWDVWNNPKHVVQWNHASEDWHSPSATNQFYVKGKFVYRMEAKDGSFGFDFSGTYMEIQEYKLVVT
ncbi:MAG: SRPBCC domain-containing protein, partial [Ignavibacteria bacterium]|nr:SRPBCC domain-containing protein [Ignavibacteria bacterium]